MKLGFRLRFALWIYKWERRLGLVSDEEHQRLVKAWEELEEPKFDYKRISKQQASDTTLYEKED